MRAARKPRPTPLWHDIERYVELRRAEGSKFRTEFRNLRLLADYLHGQDVEEIRQVTKEHLDSFFDDYGHRKPTSFNGLLSTVRVLFQWLVLQEAIPFSPLKVKSRRTGGRRTHVIIDDEDLAAGLASAARLKETKQQPLRGELWRTLFAVLIALGVREMEGASVRLEDVDLTNCTLFIREGKFGKERLLPFGPKLALHLERLIGLRRANGAAPSDFLFTFTGRKPVSATSIYRTFKVHLVPAMSHRDEYRRAYVHDLRHTFAVQTLVSWYRSGVPVNERLDDLSIFMGHVGIASTSVYLSISTEILGISSDRFEEFSASVWKQVVPV